jgi:hypothetical protein
MHVNPSDGRCRSCGGELDVIDADDVTLTVACTECADSYPLEPDGLNDGGLDYWPQAMADKTKEGGDGA